MHRNLLDLSLDAYGPPYFIQYTVDDRDELKITANFGAVASSTRERRRYVTPDVRVGSYELDNSNFQMWLGGGAFYRPLVIENDPVALRHALWLATDEVYKDALGVLSQKEAYLQTHVVTDLMPDFTRVEPLVRFGAPVSISTNQSAWETRIAALSALLKQCPDAIESEVFFEAVATNQYIVTSEGSRISRGDLLLRIEARLSALAEDGLTVSDQRNYYARTVDDLPSQDSLESDLQLMVRHVNELQTVPKIEEYVGPMIFTGNAACEVFRQLFMSNISEPRRPLYGVDHLDRAAEEKAKLARKVGRRVCVRTLDLFDDPTISSYQGLPLVGHYASDDEGVMPARLELVDAGRLKTVYGSRTPSKKRSTTSGHARGSIGRAVAARGANLIVESTEHVSRKRLEDQMMALCREAAMDYGVVVTRIADPAIRLGGGMFFTGLGDESGLTNPLEAYKLFADGHREPLRNMEFAEVGVRLLRDIMAVADDRNAAGFLLEGDDELPVSVVAPTFLVEEVEMRLTKAKPRAQPRVQSPLLNP